MNRPDASQQTTQKTSIQPGPCRAEVYTGDSLYDLTTRIAAGETEAFDIFYKVYYRRVYHYLLMLARGREEDAADALQETLIRVVRYIKPIRDPEAFWNWLRRIARTALIDQIRKKANQPLSLSSLEIASARSEETDPTSKMNDHLAVCLDHLRGLERRLVEGKYFEGKSLEDLAEEAGLSRKAVESRLARIRKRLKRMILEQVKNGP